MRAVEERDPGHDEEPAAVGEEREDAGDPSPTLQGGNGHRDRRSQEQVVIKMRVGRQDDREGGGRRDERRIPKALRCVADRRPHCACRRHEEHSDRERRDTRGNARCERPGRRGRKAHLRRRVGERTEPPRIERDRRQGQGGERDTRHCDGSPAPPCDQQCEREGYQRDEEVRLQGQHESARGERERPVIAKSVDERHRAEEQQSLEVAEERRPDERRRGHRDELDDHRRRQGEWHRASQEHDAGDPRDQEECGLEGDPAIRVQ